MVQTQGKVKNLQSVFMPKGVMTKMQPKENWRERAKALFLVEKLTIAQIADIVDVHRNTVAKYLHSLPEYEEAMMDRKFESHLKRVEYQRNWQRAKRNTISAKVDADTLKRDHETAVAELSREKYH